MRGERHFLGCAGRNDFGFNNAVAIRYRILSASPYARFSATNFLRIWQPLGLSATAFHRRPQRPTQHAPGSGHERDSMAGPNSMGDPFAGRGEAVRW